MEQILTFNWSTLCTCLGILYRDHSLNSMNPVMKDEFKEFCPKMGPSTGLNDLKLFIYYLDSIHVHNFSQEFSLTRS